jgi:hypothetical protein
MIGVSCEQLSDYYILGAVRVRSPADPKVVVNMES